MWSPVVPIGERAIWVRPYAGSSREHCITACNKEVLRFHYQTLYLPHLDARLFVEQGAVPLYGLLPAMSRVSDELLLQTIEEMIEYYQQDNDLLRDELICFSVLLRRAQPLPEAQFERVIGNARTKGIFNVPNPLLLELLFGPQHHGYN